jgi:hypothetical protein
MRVGLTCQLILILAGLVVLAAPAHAQKSIAKPGYYPDRYSGDVFTGTLASVDDSKNQITLTYLDPKHQNVLTLVAEIQEGYTVESRKEPKDHQLRATELTVGRIYTAYYCAYPAKIDGEKKTIYKIFIIDGVPNRAVGPLVYKAF